MIVVKWLAIASVVLAVLVVMVVAAGQLGLLRGKVPDHLGVSDGRLAPPSATPNSVSSQSRLYPGHPQHGYASIAPLRFDGDGTAAMDRLESVLSQMDRTVVVKRTPDYVYAQSTTPLLGFTDDLEFWLDADAGVIELRSASRLGRGDLGMNRKRIEQIRSRFTR